MINSPLPNSSTVEHVANVERMFTVLILSDESSQSHSTNKKIGHVESVEEDDLATYFSTLSTLLKNGIVESYSYFNLFKDKELCDFPRFPHFPLNPEANPINFSYFSNENVALIFSWLQVVVEEGHIEPSQPCIGKILGWPHRKFARESLFVDFHLWCHKKGVEKWHIPTRREFFYLANEVFIREANKYAFPSQEVCQSKLAILRKNYESHSIGRGIAA